MDLSIFLAAGMLVAWWLARRRTTASGPTFLPPVCLSWIGFYRGGLHAALALVPIIPFLPHAARDPGLFVEAPDAHDTLNEFEHRFKRPVDVMLFFFGLVNAGVVIGNVGAGTWLVLVAILVGKPIGITAATALSRRADCICLAASRGATCRRRHHRRHRLHGRALLRHGRVPVRPPARRNQNRRVVELFCVADRSVGGESAESRPVQLTSVICGQLDAGAL